MTMNVRHLIGGIEVDSVSGKTFPSINPSTAEVIAEVAEGNAEDVDRAVRSAQKAFDQGPWKRLSATERSKLLLRVAQIISSRIEELSKIDTIDCGKPITDNRGDVAACAEIFQYYAGVSQNIRSTVIADQPGYHQYTLREPYGVVACIAPWNFPFAQSCIKLAPALAAGNTVVLKMAEQTPLSTLELGKICLEAGIPEGVVNVVHGFGSTAGAALVSHPLVRKISFTGSSAVGKEIMRVAAEGLKSITLELGGKTPNIVFDDADLEQALSGVLFTSFFNMGQICTTGSRLLLGDKIAHEFLDELVHRARQIAVGDPMEEKTKLGPLVSEEQYRKVAGYIDSGLEEGARLIMGSGKPNVPTRLRKGYFLEPTIFGGVNMKMKIAREEIFGPVLSVMTFKDEEEAIRIANDVSYG